MSSKVVFTPAAEVYQGLLKGCLENLLAESKKRPNVVVFARFASYRTAYALLTTKNNTYTVHVWAPHSWEPEPEEWADVPHYELGAWYASAPMPLAEVYVRVFKHDKPAKELELEGAVQDALGRLEDGGMFSADSDDFNRTYIKLGSNMGVLYRTDSPNFVHMLVFEAATCETIPRSFGGRRSGGARTRRASVRF